MQAKAALNVCFGSDRTVRNSCCTAAIWSLYCRTATAEANIVFLAPLALSGEPLGGEKDELDEDEDEEESLLLGAILRSLNKLV